MRGIKTNTEEAKNEHQDGKIRAGGLSHYKRKHINFKMKIANWTHPQISIFAFLPVVERCTCNGERGNSRTSTYGKWKSTPECCCFRFLTKTKKRTREGKQNNIGWRNVVCELRNCGRALLIRNAFHLPSTCSRLCRRRRCRRQHQSQNQKKTNDLIFSQKKNLPSLRSIQSIDIFGFYLPVSASYFSQFNAFEFRPKRQR